VSPTRFLVEETKFEDFVAGFASRAAGLVIGSGLDESTQMGPLIHARRLAAIEGLIEDAKAAGATVHTGGTRIDRPGYFYAPTVISEVPLSARIMNEEPFGPVAIVNSFSDTQAAIAEANRLPYGLAAFAFTESSRVIRQMAESLEAGMVGINTFAISVPESPFGGIKESGHGSEEGIEGLEACLMTRFVSEA
jgi:succinate-semialdehyde dehydrogenase/glutarate-semialdehyde dehydrogenase